MENTFRLGIPGTAGVVSAVGAAHPRAGCCCGSPWRGEGCWIFWCYPLWWKLQRLHGHQGV